MFDCNLIKSREQKMREILLPSLESTYQKSHVPAAPATQPESELDFPVSPLLPKVLPASPNVSVPPNPLLPPGYSTVMDYEGLQYMNGYLRTQINRFMEVEFLVGSTNILKRQGRLAGVGLNYILLEDLKTGDVEACDFYTIKFCRSFAEGAAAPAE